MKKTIILAVLLGLLNAWPQVFAQSPKNPEELAQEISAAKDSRQVFSILTQAEDEYARNGKFNEFCASLRTISRSRGSSAALINYFLSLTRYDQLKYLEEKQSWDEYFDKGNDYRAEITSGLDEALKGSIPQDALTVYARLLSWQFHQDQQDAFAEEALEKLMSSAKVFAETAKDPVVLKYAADKLQSYDQKVRAKTIYRIYVEKAVSADMKGDELKKMAAGFLKDGNLELAETVYDKYIEKISGSEAKEKVFPELAQIAQEFSFKDGVLCDPAYAEKIFSQIENMSGKAVLDENMTYLRAYNLEKSRDYAKAKAVYVDLVQLFPASKYADKASFKIAAIDVYALRNLKDGREYFQKLAGKETASAEVISSLYQLGLLAQWEEDPQRAKSNYLKLKEKSGSEFGSYVSLSEERLKEIEENRLLEADIRSFLDVSLREEYSIYKMSKVELKSSGYNLKKGQEFTMTATAYPPESGCMQVVLEYAWTGDLGKNHPSAEDASFNSSYSDPGTKIIGLVVRSSGGILDRAVDLIDVE